MLVTARDNRVKQASGHNCRVPEDARIQVRTAIKEQLEGYPVGVESSRRKSLRRGKRARAGKAGTNQQPYSVQAPGKHTYTDSGHNFEIGSKV